MLDALRGYVQVGVGLAEVGLRKAGETALSMLPGDISEAVPSRDTATGAARAVSTQVQDLADDLVSGATANREMLVGLIRTEIDRTAGRVGFVREEELAAVRRHVGRLESQLAEVRAGLAEVNSQRPKKATPAAKAGTAAKPSSRTTQATTGSDPV